jgi:acetyl-CoA carboxylase beta subunit
VQWEQKDGFRIKKAANSIIDEINKIINMPDKCPTCNSTMYNDETRLNKKFWKTHKTCFGCVIKTETLLRAEGKYEEYARKKMYENAKSFFESADKEVVILKDALKNKLEFVQNAQGEVEEFDQTDYNKKYLKYIDDQYNRFKKETLSELDKDE